MIQFEVKKNIAHICLDRPSKLNALNKDLLRELSQILDKVEEEEKIKAVCLDSTSPKAFCAGGDIVEIYKRVQATGEDPLPYFRREFIVDKRIAKFKKPVVACLQGVAMGGGLGLTMDCPIKIVDENTKMAMPEARLGMIPDVGMGYFFSNLPQGLALYLSLTGRTMNGQDAKNISWATHLISSDKWDSFKEDLFALDLSACDEKESLEKIKTLTDSYNTDIEPKYKEEDYREMDQLFGGDSLKEIFQEVKENRPDLYQDLEEASLLSLALIYLKYGYGKEWTREETFDMDLKVIDYCYHQGDMVEGIRTVMVDKEDEPNFIYYDLQDLPWKDLHELLKGEKDGRR